MNKKNHLELKKYTFFFFRRMSTIQQVSLLQNLNENWLELWNYKRIHKISGYIQSKTRYVHFYGAGFSWTIDYGEWNSAIESIENKLSPNVDLILKCGSKGKINFY